MVIAGRVLCTRNRVMLFKATLITAVACLFDEDGRQGFTQSTIRAGVKQQVNDEPTEVVLDISMCPP